MKDYSAAVSRASVDTQEIDVTSCAPNPPVAHVTLGKAVVFSNHDSVVRGLGYGDKLQIDVPAKSQQTVTPTFKSPGIYPYRCGQDFAGIFLVTP
jgi:plastocyanin